jgi:phage shock protein C
MNKKLQLSATDKKIAGVCGGLAEYFNIDSLIVRIVFLALAMGGSVGIWIYLLVWLLAPKAN